MRSRQRNITVFSISALDLFAAALGAFILIVLVLFPYYRLGGTDVSFEELEQEVERRRAAAATQQTELSEIRAIQAEIRLLNLQYRTTEENMSEIEDKLQEVLKQTAEVEIPDPPPVPKPDPEPIPEPPRSVARGVEFSILGLATNQKDIAIVVDMSGSMTAHRAKVTSAINEILDQMRPDNNFVIIGYRRRADLRHVSAKRSDDGGECRHDLAGQILCWWHGPPVRRRHAHSGGDAPCAEPPPRSHHPDERRCAG